MGLQPFWQPALILYYINVYSFVILCINILENKDACLLAGADRGVEAVSLQMTQSQTLWYRTLPLLPPAADHHHSLASLLEKMHTYACEQPAQGLRVVT